MARLYRARSVRVPIIRHMAGSQRARPVRVCGLRNLETTHRLASCQTPNRCFFQAIEVPRQWVANRSPIPLTPLVAVHSMPDEEEIMRARAQASAGVFLLGIRYLTLSLL